MIGSDAPVDLRFGLSGGFSSGGDFFRHGSGVGFSAPASARNVARPGNLIVKTLKRGSAAVKTLTCTFQADASGYGVGDCQGRGGATHALQF